MKSFVEQAREQIALTEYRLQETPLTPGVYTLFSEVLKSLQLLNIAVAEQARNRNTSISPKGLPGEQGGPG